MNLENLRQKPLWQMTGEEFIELFSKVQQPQQNADVNQSQSKKYVYGLAGLEQLLDCSHVTAQRIKDSGKINGCFSQVGRKLVFDSEAVINALKK